MKRISTIVPAYNCESTIIPCLDSIVNQDWENKEIIVVDDSSTDATYERCCAFAKTNKIVRVISTEHIGVSACRNLGLKHSTGDFIAFCDADDELLLSALSSMAIHLDNTIDLVVGNVIKRNAPVYKEKIIISSKEALNLFFQHNERRIIGSVYGKLFKKSYIELLSGSFLTFDENIHVGEDALFLLKYLLRCNSACLIDSLVYKHNYSKNGIIASKKPQEYLTALDACKKMILEVSKYDNLYISAVKDLCWVFSLLLERLPKFSTQIETLTKFRCILDTIVDDRISLDELCNLE